MRNVFLVFKVETTFAKINKKYGWKLKQFDQNISSVCYQELEESSGQYNL